MSILFNSWWVIEDMGSNSGGLVKQTVVGLARRTNNAII